MSQNFKATRKLRRAVLKEIEQQQKADSEAAIKVRSSILASTKELLESLSSLLDWCAEEGNVSRAEREIFLAIAPSLSIDDWLRCRKQYGDCEASAALAQACLDRAQKSYDEVATFGIVSKLFKNENEKRIFDALKSNRDKLADDLSDLRQEARRLEGSVREKSKEFLQQAMRKESLEFLRNSQSPISRRVKVDLKKMTEDVGSLVRDHASIQRESLGRVQQYVADLAAAYNSNV
jgi:hypothetical protein